MAVDRGARDLKQIGDALDGVVPCVVELLGVVGLVGGDFGASSPLFHQVRRRPNGMALGTVENPMRAMSRRDPTARIDVEVAAAGPLRRNPSTELTTFEVIQTQPAGTSAPS